MKGCVLFFRKKTGSALIAVLIIFLILSILSLAAIEIGSSEENFSQKDADSLRAYYIARSGAEAYAENALNSSELNLTDSIAFGGGSFKVTDINLDNPNSPCITVLGKYNKSSKKVKLSLKPRSLFGCAVYAKGTLNMANNSELNGNVEIAGPLSSVTDPKKRINGTITPNVSRIYPGIPLHKNPNTASALKIKKNTTITGMPDVYNYIDLGSANILNVNTEGNKIEIDTNYISGNNSEVHVFGGGTLIFHTNYLDFKGSLTTEPKTTTIIVIAPNGSAHVDLQTGNSNFQAFIYGPSADVTIKANYLSIGAIIANNVSFEAGGKLDYAPSYNPYFDPSMLGLPSIGYVKNKWED